MAHLIGDRAKETTSTTGTGSFTTTGAVTGYVTLASVMTTNGDTSWYCAQSGAEWEVGLCTRSSSTSYARTTVLASSNSGSAVNFTVAPIIFLTVPASSLTPLGGPTFRAYLSSDQTGITNQTFIKVQLGTESYDLGSCFDSSTNYRFTPTVAGYYRFDWCVDVAATSLTSGMSALRKNGDGSLLSYGSHGAASSFNEYLSTGSDEIYMNGSSDYVELFGYGVGTTIRFESLDVGGSATTRLSGALVRAA